MSNARGTRAVLSTSLGGVSGSVGMIAVSTPDYEEGDDPSQADFINLLKTGTLYNAEDFEISTGIHVHFKDKLQEKSFSEVLLHSQIISLQRTFLFLSLTCLILSIFLIKFVDWPDTPHLFSFLSFTISIFLFLFLLYLSPPNWMIPKKKNLATSTLSTVSNPLYHRNTSTSPENEPELEGEGEDKDTQEHTSPQIKLKQLENSLSTTQLKIVKTLMILSILIIPTLVLLSLQFSVKEEDSSSIDDNSSLSRRSFTEINNLIVIDLNVSSITQEEEDGEVNNLQRNNDGNLSRNELKGDFSQIPGLEILPTIWLLYLSTFQSLNTILIILVTSGNLAWFCVYLFQESISSSVIYISIIGICLLITHKVQRKLRKEFILNYIIKYEKMVSFKLLEAMLPRSIANQLIQSKIANEKKLIAHSFPNVTIIFVEIMNFVDLTCRLDAEEVAELLSTIYATWDILTRKHGAFKVETVGETYMAASGVPEHNRRHASVCANLALDILNSTTQFTTPDFLPVRIRIGINSGPVAAGVVGTRKYAYHLFGDTVNTASRMESTCLPMKIQVSPTTYKLIKDKYIFEDRGIIDVKGKGKMHLRFLVGNKIRTVHHQNPRSPLYRDPDLNWKDTFLVINEQDLSLHSMNKEGKHLMDFFTLVYQDLNSEIDFLFHKITRKLSKFRRILFSMSIILFFIAMFTPSYELFIVSGIPFVLMLISFWGSFFRYSSHFLFFAFSTASVFLNIYFYRRYNLLCSEAVLTIILVLTVNHNLMCYRAKEATFCSLFIVSFYFLGVCFTFSEYNEVELQDMLAAIIPVLLSSSILLVEHRNKEISERSSYLLKHDIEREKEKASFLLKEMLPETVYQQLLVEKHFFATTYEHVCLLYSDIEGFTDMSSSMRAEDLILLLSKIYSAFDRHLAIRDVYKIDTIGDAYVVTTGIPHSHDQFIEAENIVKMAVDMLREISNFRTPEGRPIRMRIGIHSGVVQGGVIGLSGVRFNIWGKDAIVCNKLESNGKPNAIHISEVTRAFLPEYFNLKKYKTLDLGNLGVINTYLLTEEHFPNVLAENYPAGLGVARHRISTSLNLFEPDNSVPYSERASIVRYTGGIRPNSSSNSNP